MTTMVDMTCTYSLHHSIIIPQIAPVETLGEIYDQVVVSPARNYFIAVLFTAVGIIFIVGISCGRVTKRVTAELKNK